MKIGEIFQYENIVYSILDVFRREVRVGTGIFNDTVPNAVNADYTGLLNIPNFVTYSNIVWRVTEIGSCSFVYCLNINSVKIGYNIETIQRQAFFRCKNIESVIFENHSRLKSLKYRAFYDLYKVKSIEFGGNNLQTIGEDAFGFNYLLKNLRLPASVNFIENLSFRGLDSFERLDFCGKTTINTDVFSRVEVFDHITPKNIEVRVTSSYPSNKFGKDDIVVVDDSLNCEFPQSIRDLDLQCRTCYRNYFHICYSLFIICTVFYES